MKTIDQNNEKRYPQVADIWYQIIKKIEMLQFECKSDSFQQKLQIQLLDRKLDSYE